MNGSSRTDFGDRTSESCDIREVCVEILHVPCDGRRDYRILTKLGECKE